MTSLNKDRQGFGLFFGRKTGNIIEEIKKLKLRN